MKKLLLSLAVLAFVTLLFASIGSKTVKADAGENAIAGVHKPSK